MHVPAAWIFEILLRLLIEGFLATGRAEVIGFALIFGFASRGLGVDLHATDGIDFHTSFSFERYRIAIDKS